MTVANISEITATSNVSFEEAISSGIDRANQTLRNVRSAWVKDQEIEIKDGKATAYKVTMKVTFVLDD